MSKITSPKIRLTHYCFFSFDQTFLIVWFSYNYIEIFEEYKEPGIIKNTHIKLKSPAVELLKYVYIYILMIQIKQ